MQRQKDKIRQWLTALVRDTTGFYLSFQAPETEFDKSVEVFEKIVQSVMFAE